MFWRQLLMTLLVLVHSECDDEKLVEFTGKSGNYKVVSTISLPDIVDETSGLQIMDSLVLTINDSGNDPVIYGLGISDGKLKKSWFLKDGNNKDWEDIAIDEDYLFVGDFGNNIGSRKDLLIYKITLQQMRASDTVDAEKIEFSFEDQTSYLPSIYNHSFDCEALISVGDSLMIFSKDWKSQITSCYALPKMAGSYLAKRKFEFQSEGLITGADYLEEENLLVLCGYKSFNPFIWRIKGIDFDNGTFSKAVRYEITDYSGIQNEGLTFLTSDSLYMSSEARYIKQKIYVIHLSD